MLCLLTRSASEWRSTSKVTNPLSITYCTKRVHQLFSNNCVLYRWLLFHFIAHTTDTVESQGGSALLVEILNRLGICVSADILSRFIQLCVKQTPSNTVSQARPNPSITHGLVTLDRFSCVTLWWPCRQSDWLWSHDLLISTGETAELENRHGASTNSTPT